jgi:hypothetical protein
MGYFKTTGFTEVNIHFYYEAEDIKNSLIICKDFCLLKVVKKALFRVQKLKDFYVVFSTTSL